MKVYFAAPLFSDADYMYNEHVASQIEEKVKGLDIYLPQRNMAINDKSETHASPVDIVKGDDEHLLQSDIMIALLDGIAIDEGVACEVGVFSNSGNPIFGLYTDSRQEGTDNELKIKELQKSPVSNPFMYKNSYVVGKVQMNGEIYSSVNNLIEDLSKYVGEL